MRRKRKKKRSRRRKKKKEKDDDDDDDDDDENKNKKVSHRQLRSVAWELTPFGALSWRELNIMKPVYDP